MMKPLTGRIADIQRASLHDGPGIRTTVFFKGCPLQCAWCHNPECISPDVQTLFYPDKCIGCGRCAEGCFAGARVTCGRDVTVDELMEEILQDEVFYANGGGVTFSGGEPMLQKDFLHAVIDRCKEKGIHCAIETSLVIFDAPLLQKLDLVMADIKIWDSRLHKQYTGVGNERIKTNFEWLNGLGVPIHARTPLIPEIEQGIPQISQFLKGLSSVKKYELLPYHPLGIEKAEALQIEQRRFSVPDKELLNEVEQYAFIR